MTIRTTASILCLLLLGACTAVPKSAPAPAPTVRPPPGQVPPTRPAPPVTSARTPQVQRIPGLEGVIEQDAAALQRLFGAPRLDVHEGDMRKLQWTGQACVLDVFLYPLRAGAEPIATYAEARRASDGQEVDRAACVAALRRR